KRRAELRRLDRIVTLERGQKTSCDESRRRKCVEQAEFAQRVRNIDGSFADCLLARALRRVACKFRDFSAAFGVAWNDDKERVGALRTEGAMRLEQQLLLAAMGARCEPERASANFALKRGARSFFIARRGRG